MKTFIVLLVLTFSTVGTAVVFGQSSSILTYRVAAPDKVKAGDTMRVIISLALRSGWYVYAPTPLNSATDLMVTQLKFVKVPKFIASTTAMQKPDIQWMNHHEVFAGTDNQFIQSFVVRPGTPPGPYAIEAQLKYQACSEAICYTPVTEKIPVYFEVVGRRLQN